MSHTTSLVTINQSARLASKIKNATSNIGTVSSRYATTIKPTFTSATCACAATTSASTTLTVNAVVGTLAVGQVIAATSGITAGTTITVVTAPVAGTTIWTLTLSAVATLTAADVITTVGTYHVIEEVMNYVKIMPRFTAAGASPSIRVIGWNHNTDTGLWIPQLLTDVTLTRDSSDSITIGETASMLGVSLITKNIGDCKIYNATSLNTGAFFVVDATACQLIELNYRTTTTTCICNAIVGEL